MIRSAIAFAVLAAFAGTAIAQPSIITSSNGRSIILSGVAAKPEQVKPAIPAKPTESDLLRLEVDRLKNSLSEATGAARQEPLAPQVKKDSSNYLVAFTASWCGPCQRWKRDELPNLTAAGIDVTIVDVDKEPQWRISSLPTFWVVERATRQPKQKLVGFTDSGVLLKLTTETGATVLQPANAAKPATANRLPRVIRTQWGTIDLETYNRNCNCPMCQGIRSLQRQYRQQYNQTSLEAQGVDDSPDQAPTPDSVINETLSVLQLARNDVLADLGCGDARILIAAVKRFGCRAIGVEIDPAKASEARRSVADAGLSGRVEIITGDALDFDPESRGVTAIVAYLYPELLAQLAPKFRQPGVRVVVTPFHQVPGLTMQHAGDVWAYRPTSLPVRSGIFGDIGTSHESRETLVFHLLNDGKHRGRHSAGDLAQMSDEQLEALHNRDHSVLN